MPKGVNKKKKKFRANLTNRIAYSKKALKRKKESRSTESSIKEAWDSKISARRNLEAMSLAVDPNEAVPLRQPRRLIIDAVPIEGVSKPELMEVDPAPPKKVRKINPNASEVLPAIEEKAKAAEEKIKHEKATVRRHHLPDRDIELAIYFIEKYDDDYQAMSRDPRNLFQHTPKQIKKVINIYKESPMFKAING